MFYLTTAIDYTNSAPHIGHAYEKILADVIARYRRLSGDEVHFLTGVDQHGQKVQQAAEKEGVSPEEFVAHTTARFSELWEKLGVHYDSWAQTTDPRHKACVGAILTSLKEQGQLYKKSHSGSYSIRQEQFLQDRDRDANGNFGAEWGEVVEIAEENWYFKLSEHTDWLKDFLEASPDLIIPDFRRSELLNALEKNSGIDLCISRPKERLQWGIEFPFDKNYVTYVWFDALINYISFAGYKSAEDSDLPDFETIWSGRPVHVIGKDILIPAHGIYWFCMLHAMGFSDAQMPHLLVHGFWNGLGGTKMSKSTGNVVDPDKLAEKFGVEAIRYYLMRDIVTGKDSDFDIDRLVMLFNTELANELGNLCNRALNMSQRFTAGILNQWDATADDHALQQSLRVCSAAYRSAMENYEISKALEAVNRHVVHCNQYAERMKPWELNKHADQKERLATVLYHLAESVAHAAVLISPVLPAAANHLAEQLNDAKLKSLKLSDLRWGLLPNGHSIGKPLPIFPRIVTEASSD